MSDEYISFREDKENLLYIYRKIKLEQLQYEDLNPVESIASTDSLRPMTWFESTIGIQAVHKGVGPENVRDPEMIAKTKPFDFVWTHCINSKVDMINLTTEYRKGIFFASSHLPVFFDYCHNSMKCLEGHQHLISSISADQSGRWLATADENKDGCVLIWDSNEFKPVYSLFNIYCISGTLLLKLSPSAKYLITIGIRQEGSYSVDFWLWTLGKDEPEDSCEVDKSYGTPVEVCFNPNVEEFIMVIFKKQVLLLNWDAEEKKFTKYKSPYISNQSKIGTLTAGTYLYNCHECYACSTKGCILTFGSTLYSKPFNEGSLDNSKIYINAVKVTRVAIRSCAATSSALVVGDEIGRILFFDRTVRILYWLMKFHLGPIVSISFNKIPNFKKEDSSAIYIVKRSDSDHLDCSYSDISDELEVIFKNDLPKDASLKGDPFLLNDFFVATSDNNVHAIDFLHHKCVPLLLMTEDNISAIDIHEELPYIVVAYANGRIQLINYKENELLCSTILPKTDNSTSISCIKYSPQSIHLICGRENGEIFILESILLEPKNKVPFKSTPNRIVKIVFANNNKQFAYYDVTRIVVLFKFNSETHEWTFVGKIRSHYADITDIVYIAYHGRYLLYTIGLDRHIVEYNTSDIESGKFSMIYRERFEQRAIPMTFLYWFDYKDGNKVHYLMVADNEQKFKFVEPVSKLPKSMILAPAFGCFKNQIISKMRIVPDSDSRYMVFMTGKFLGIHMMKPDGNPYKYTGYMGHPSKVEDFVLTPDGNYVFTFGKDDHCVFKWKIKPKAVELMHTLGGKELEPYYCLIEGGKNGWLFQEIKDLFYYMQCLQHENADLPKKVSDTINITEIPELVRTCGFYPSEFELENMMIDIKYRHYEDTGLYNSDISFIDFVKLFCNHKPVYGYSKDTIKKAFRNMIEQCVGDNYGAVRAIDRNDFTAILTCAGECINPSNLIKLLQTLMRMQDTNDNFEFLPENITFKMFIEQILGLGKEHITREHREKRPQRKH